jgi:hypothetical protein
MIQNYDKFSKWNAKSGRIYTLWNFHIYSTMINKEHVIYWDIYIYIYITSCKRFHSKILSYEKMKRTKKNSQSFCKVIMLVPIYVLAPKNQPTKIWKTHHDIAKLEAQGEN